MTHPNTIDRFVARVVECGPFDDAHPALEAVEVTLELLGERLSDDERAWLSAELPPRLGEYLRRSTKRRAFSLETFYEHVAERLLDVSRGMAIERAQITGRVLAEWLTTETLERLRKVAPEFSDLLRIGDEPPLHDLESPPRPRPARHSLSEGRPGSTHPLSASRPERAHTDSIARSDDPHADTKLSSSHGLTQEREHDTLAQGRPGTKRPLSG